MGLLARKSSARRTLRPRSPCSLDLRPVLLMPMSFFTVCAQHAARLIYAESYNFAIIPCMRYAQILMYFRAASASDACRFAVHKQESIHIPLLMSAAL